MYQLVSRHGRWTAKAGRGTEAGPEDEGWSEGRRPDEAGWEEAGGEKVGCEKA